MLPEEHKTARSSWPVALCHMRTQLLVSLTAIMAAAVAVLATTFVLWPRDALGVLERVQAVQEARTFFGVMQNQLAALKNMDITYAWVVR
eukprot:m51a1_g3649 hypothetical protein (90) ;mRNA; r:205589-205858